MVSKKTEYALKTLIELAMAGKNELLNVKDIAKKQAIPQSFLSQIMSVMKRDGLVSSVRGPRGGYQLARDPAQIKVADLMRLTEDHGFLSDIVHGVQHNVAAGDEMSSVLTEYWEVLGALVEARLLNTTVKDLCDRVKNLRTQGVLDYVI